MRRPACRSSPSPRPRNGRLGSKRSRAPRPAAGCNSPEGQRHRERDPGAGDRGRALPRLDRRAGRFSRRGVLAGPLHPAPTEGQVVVGQPARGARPDRGGPHASGRSRRDRARQVRRALGRSLRAAERGESVRRLCRAALDASPAARDAFTALDSHNRFAMIYRVEDARKPETRAKRIAAYVAMLERGERLHPRKRSRS